MRWTGILVGCLLVAGPLACGDDYKDEALVRDYCVYGAVSVVQLEGCTGHVTADYVRQSKTNAANWARDGGECLADAGPFCQKALDAEKESFDEDLRNCDPAYLNGGRGGC